jgi:heavy metal translocating P-type ATPase
MGIATPLATALAMGRAAREGVLVRGGDVLERIGQITTAFFDKTGTVTTNHPQVVAVEVLDGATPDAELLGCAATLESGSEHSLARAIVAEARKREVEAGRLLSLEAVPGMGVRGKIQWRGMERTVVAGTEEFARAGGGSLLPPAGYGTVVCVAWDGKVRGRITLADEIRPGAAASVEQLRRQGISTALLSGDRAEVADAIGRRVGVDRVEAPRLPEQKILAVRAAEKDGHVAAMVGDGINDAPALAAAGVGIALGAGTDIARQSGNVVLLSDRLEQIPWLIRLSRYTRRIVMQNLLWAFGYNAVALAAAAMGWLHPLLAALAMVVSSVTVLGNSLRIQRFPAVNSTPGTRR